MLEYKGQNTIETHVAICTYREMILGLIFVFSTCLLNAQEDPAATEVWEPVPRKILSGKNCSAPSDAIILLDGTDLSNFESAKGGKVTWNIEDDCVTVRPGSGDIRSRQKFGDCQLHIEWRTPVSDIDHGQGRGNSGVFLMGRYEVQILDSYANETYPNGQAGSIYKQHIPLVNASLKAGEWQTYDIIFTAPKFEKDGKLISQARVTVLHNGVLVQNNVALLGPTRYIGLPAYQYHEEKESLILQDHGDLVSYRNIWIREL